MKTGFRILKLLIVLCCAFVTTGAFAQTFTLTFTNSLGATYQGVPLNGTTNFSGNNGNAAPNDTVPVTGSILTFDGTVPGTIYMFQLGNIAFNGQAVGGGFGSIGLSIDLTPSQTSPVNVFADTNQASPPTIGMDAFRVQGPGGQLIFGDNSTRQFITVARPGPGTHLWINNSTNPVTINPNHQIQNGGGAGGHVINFQGTGDFNITNALRWNNNAPSQNLIWDSTGTTIWSSDGGNGTPGGNTNLFNSALGTITINAGTIIVKMPRLIPNTPGANTVAHSGTLLRFDAPAADSDTIVRTFSGNGPIQFNSGTWTLTSGGSTISGNIALNGGQVNVAGTEVAGVSGPLGFGNVISFNGGRLGFSAFNTFDYSPRFNTAAGQQYKIDTAGQSVTFTNNLASSGGTFLKFGNGTLTLAGSNSYSGLTTVSNGTLALVGPKTGTGNILVNVGATLGIFEADGRTNTPATLTLWDANLEYDNMTNRTRAPLQAATLVPVGTQTIAINSGIFSIGKTNPLLSWTTGSAPATSLGVVDGGGGILNTNGNTIEFITTSVALAWLGTNGGNWTAPGNWTSEGIPTTFAPLSPVLFDDSAPGTTAVIVDALVQPAGITVNNSTKTYSITSSGGNNIGGSTGLTKRGTNTLTLSGGANTYTGVTTISGGTVSVGAPANGGSASDIGAAASSAANLVFKGGTLRYTGAGANANRLFTVTTAGGTIDASGTGPLNLNGIGQIGLSGTLTLTGNNTDTNTLACSLINSGSLTKTGPGKWILTGTNTYGGGTIVNNGILQVGASPSGEVGSGPIQLNNGTALIFKRTGTLTVPGVISGTGSVTKEDSGTVILENNNSYSGGTTINAGTLQVGNGGATGEIIPDIYGGGAITNNSLLIFNTTGTFAYYWPNMISGTGNVIVRGGGLIKALGIDYNDYYGYSYTGWTLIEPGSTFQPCEGNQGALLSSVVTNNGTLKMVRQDIGVFFYSNNIVGTGRLLKEMNDNNDCDVTLLGTNTYTGGTIIAAGGVVLGDGVTPGAGSIAGNVFFTNSAVGQDVDRRIVFNRPEDVTFGGTVSGLGGTTFGGTVANAGRVEQRGANSMLTLTANNSHLNGATIVDATGRLRLGNGGLTGSAGGGTIANAGTLIFNRSGSSINGALTVGAITGAGSVQQANSGIILATGNNTYAGNTVISNGTLALRGTLGGSVTLAGGNLAPGGLGAVGTLTNAGALNWNSGTIVVTLNKSLVQSNSFISAGSISYTGGGLKLLNYGPPLVIGDKFFLFNQAVAGAGSAPINSPGYTFANGLATDGSVTVSAVSPSTLALTETHSGGTNQTITWPAAFTGLSLYSQTNGVLTNAAPTGGITTNWFKVIGSDAVAGYTNNAFNKFNKSVFFRLQPY